MADKNPSKKLLRSTRAVSPLVATLLLIAIAVAASVITYSWVMSMIGSQSQQAQTQIRIDMITWVNSTGGFDDYTTTGNYTVPITVRNTGSVPASVEAISMRANVGGTPYTTHELSTPVTIQVGEYRVIPWVSDELPLAYSSSYVVRVTTTTGFFYEMIDATPEAPAP